MSMDEWFHRWFPNLCQEDDFDTPVKDHEPTLPEDFVKEQRLPNGTVRRELGPFVHGYAFTLDREGRPVVSEFGNFKPTSSHKMPHLELLNPMESRCPWST
jgi:hypothetical protein